MTKKFLIEILEWMERDGTTMSDVFIRFPDGEELTYGEIWNQITDGTGYGGRCYQIYKEIGN